MRLSAIICLVLACTLGCGSSDKPDNSAIQTPDDQPLGSTKGPDGKMPMDLGNGMKVQGKAGAGATEEKVPEIKIQK